VTGHLTSYLIYMYCNLISAIYLVFALTMANTRYAYVRNFELPDPLLPDTFLVVRVDGHAFHR